MTRGLVDSNGGITTAFRIIKELIQTEDEIRLIEVVPGRNPTILERYQRLPFSTSSEYRNEPLLPQDLKNLLEMYRNLSRYKDKEALYLLPYSEEELSVPSR
jgi:hypothetical protein